MITALLYLLAHNKRSFHSSGLARAGQVFGKKISTLDKAQFIFASKQRTKRQLTYFIKMQLSLVELIMVNRENVIQTIMQPTL
jgi:hypothetical protein